MLRMLWKIQDFIKDDLLRLKRFTSPMDGKTVSKHQYKKEIKYIAEIDVMFTTIEDCIFPSEDLEVEKKRLKQLNDDGRYVEIYNQIITEGVKSIPEEDQVWLRDYVAKNKTHWHDSKFHIIRRD